MGFCCSKKVLSSVDSRRHERRGGNSSFAVLLPPIDFDLLLADDNHDVSFGVAACPPVLGIDADAEEADLAQSIRTVSEYGTITDAPVNFSATMRDELNVTMVTNGCEEIRKRDVDAFVNSVLNMSKGQPECMLEGTFYAKGLNCRRNRAIMRTGIASLNNSMTFTTEQENYLDSGLTFEERLARLTELEQMSRQEIFGAWQMTSVLLQLARSRVMPTIRRRRLPVRWDHSVLVIQAQDIDDPNENSFLAETRRSMPLKLRAPNEQEDNEKMNNTSIEHYQLFTLSGCGISLTGDVHARVVSDSWDFLSLPSAREHLNAGNVYFRFLCSTVSNLKKDSLELINAFVNLTSFKDEVKENNVPKVDIFSDVAHNKYVAILVKTMYILPGVSLGNLTPELLASLDYQRHCQPGDNKFEEVDTPYTFRTVKSVIKFVYSITIQMKVSEITDPEVLQSFVDMDGMTPTRVLMLERTKKNIAKTDSTVKVRSFLAYYAVNDGFLVANQTIVLNSALPRIASSLMQTFGSQGSKEAAETAKLTRQYMVHRFGDSRA